MTQIARVDVGAGGVASISFTSIPSSYTDLMVVLTARTNRPTYQWDNIAIGINGSTTNSERSFYAIGSSGTGSATSSAGGLSYADTNVAVTNAFSNNNYYFPNYLKTVVHPYYVDSVTEDTNSTTAYMSFVSGVSTSTAAITSLSFTAATLQQYSSATLYGVATGSSGGVTVS